MWEFLMWSQSQQEAQSMPDAAPQSASRTRLGTLGAYPAAVGKQVGNRRSPFSASFRGDLALLQPQS